MLNETRDLKLELFDVLNKLKNMEAGMSSKLHDSIYLRYKGKPYAIHLIELEDAEVTEKDRKKYVNCDDTYIKDMKNITSMETFLRD